MDTSTAYRRLVIVDPQFKDRKGHNYRYAKGIAAELGLPCTVLADVSMNPVARDGLDIRPCLDFDQYNNSIYKDAFRPGVLERADLLLTRINQRLERENALWPSDSPLAVMLRFLAKIPIVLLFIPALLVQMTSLLRGRGSSVIQDTTALQLSRAFKSANLDEGDLLVFQTMLWPTFESLLELRVLKKGVYGCDALFIVHEDWLIYNTGFARFSPGRFRQRVLESLPFRASKVVSTNGPLSDYCERMTGYMPPVMREIDFPVDTLPEKSASPDGDIRILVPGVYRGDKNFESAKDWIDEVLEAHPGASITFHESVMARVNPAPQHSRSYSVYSDIEGAGAWLEFLASFDLVLLPYGEAYRHRISGIIHEARVLNLPVVCSEVIADASLLGDAGCRYSDEPGSVASAISAALAAGESGSYFKEEYPPSISEALADGAGWVGFMEKPIAVQVKPAWTRCGTSVVLDAQMDYLVERGYFLIEVYLKTEPWLATREQVEFMWQVMRGGREFSGGSLVRVLLKDVRLFKLLRYFITLSRGGIRAFLQRENVHGTWCPLDRNMADFLKANPADLVLVNHVFNSDFAFHHIPGRRYVCESHDIQINQLLMRRPELRVRYEAELAYELEVLSKYELVINLNRTEHLLINSRIGDKAIFIRPPLISREITLRYDSLTALIREQSNYKYLDKLPPRFDLLIIGDGHPANVESVQSFVEKVYPALPRGISLGIVGKVCMHLEVDWSQKIYKDVHPIGFLDQLANLYDFTRVLVLPDLVGEGIPIKTDEAIAHGVRFVATKHALRGFTTEELVAVGIEAATGEDDMVIKIMTQLEAGDAAVENTVREKLTAMHNMRRYFEHWDEALESVNQVGSQ